MLPVAVLRQVAELPALGSQLRVEPLAPVRVQREAQESRAL